MISLVVALTVTPMLMNLFFPEGRPRAEKMGPVVRLSRRALESLQRAVPVLDFCLRRPWLVVSSILLVSVVGLGALRRMEHSGGLR